ncbi:MAG: hypothetical protein M1838_000603 [Thelocarpon superellum]|nr:MAG: hypothetical protein M1838_000603 [Thelocarpon superellum]
MAYPFTRHHGSPKTPDFIKGFELSSRKAPHPRPKMGYVRFLCIFLVTIVALFLTLHPWLHRPSTQLDRIPFAESQITDYFGHFQGRQDCGISSEDVYLPPPSTHRDGTKGQIEYCKNRATLLEALNGGGRHGFDAPYTPKACHYRWYSTAEICMILDRFDGIIFVGDNTLRQVYAAFNVLLRENAALGALKQWEMNESERGACRCESQFIKADCARFAVAESEEVKKNDAGSGHQSPYYCNRTPHKFLSITSSPASDEQRSSFHSIAEGDPESYKPIPIILSLSLGASLSWPSTTASMDEWVSLAETSERSVPMLWLGPVAAGHLKPPGQILSQGNNALWHFTVEMTKEARARDMDSLNMYNLTLQASSWDGSGYGEKVALVQAQMIINWLSRLDST